MGGKEAKANISKEKKRGGKCHRLGYGFEIGIGKRITFMLNRVMRVIREPEIE